METIQQITLTEAQVAKLDAGSIVVIKASWEEFMDLLAETSYRVEYHNGHIIFMGLAAFIHELLVGNMIALLKAVTKGKGYYVAGSNVGVLKTPGKKGYYNPDVTVVKGSPTFALNSNAIITNPFMVVEVLSESTATYDLQHKLPKYAQIDFLQCVVFVDRFDYSITVSLRSEQPNVWTQTHYYHLTDIAQLGEFTIPLNDVFADLPEETN